MTFVCHVLSFGDIKGQCHNHKGQGHTQGHSDIECHGDFKVNLDTKV